MRFGGVLTGYAETGSLYIRDQVDETFTIIREDALAFPVVGAPSQQAMRSVHRLPFPFTASVRVPMKQVVVMGGALVRRTQSDSLVTWTYRSSEPVPFLNITVAPYRIVEARGIRAFVFPEDSARGVTVHNAVLAALDTPGQWFGPLPNMPDLPIMEIPEGFGSQASLTAGIILTADAFRGNDMDSAA